MRPKSKGGTIRRQQLTDAAARRIAGIIIRMQHKAVRVLERLERRCSLRQKKILLLAFCLSCSLYCGVLLLDALTGGRERNIIPLPLQTVVRSPAQHASGRVPVQKKQTIH